MTTSTRDDAITVQAAGLYIATSAYREALRMPTPAATLDRMAGAVHEITPDACAAVSTASTFADSLRDATTSRLKAFAAIEHARNEAGDGYGYLFDLLAESLSNGADPVVTLQAAAEAPGRIRELAEAAL